MQSAKSLPCKVKPARGIRHRSDLATLLDCLCVLVEHGELYSGLGASLAQREAHEDSEDEREGGHHDDDDTESLSELVTRYPKAFILTQRSYRCGK